MYYQLPFSEVDRGYLALYIHVYSQINDSMQSFSLNIYSLDPCGHDLQSIVLHLEMQFVSVYFDIFLRLMFYINFRVS